MLELTEIKKLSFDEVTELVNRAKTSPAAEAELLKQYLPMFFSIAKEYWNYPENRSRIQNLSEIDDIVQESYEPFKKSIRDYDASRGFKFITLAERYIRQHLDNLLKEERALRRHPHVKTWDESVKKFVPVYSPQPVSIYKDIVPSEVGDELELIIDTLRAKVTENPDWQVHFEFLVQRVDELLDSQIKKDVFHKLLEFGLQPKRLKQIRQELGLSSSALSNILGRDIYPAVEKALELANA